MWFRKHDVVNYVRSIRRILPGVAGRIENLTFLKVLMSVAIFNS
jgi:hypothetical protein